MRLGLVLAALAVGAAAPPGASSCTGCHGAGSPVGVLAGREAGSTEGAMKAFGDGERPATLMNRIAKGFTPEQTHAIAAWFAQQ